MNFPGSPYFVLARLLEEYRSGQRSPEDVARSLDTFDMFVEQWGDNLQAVPDEPDVAPQMPVALEGSHDALGCFDEASGFLREYLETGDEHLAERALEVARQGHETLEQLFLGMSKVAGALRHEVG